MQTVEPAKKLTAEQKLQLLVQFGTHVSAEVRLEKLLDSIAQQITLMLDVGRCTIYLVDEERQELWSKIAQGKGLEYTEIHLPLHTTGIIPLVARTGETVNVPNAYEDSRFSMAIDMVTDFRTQSLLAVPLKNNDGKVIGVFAVANKAGNIPFDQNDEGILLLLSTMAGSAIEIATLYQEVQNAQLETIYRLAVTAEYRDQQDTRSHLKNIGIISFLLANALGMTKYETEIIRDASPLHDIGKVALADSILLKPAKLTKEEFEKMKLHTIYGGKILEGARSKILQTAYKMSLYHHEKWDGSGYPKGLKGEEIPLAARIVAVADVFDALCQFRVYKQAWTTENAYNYIVEEAGKSFDPRVVEAFRKKYPAIRKLYTSSALFPQPQTEQPAPVQPSGKRTARNAKHSHK